jgi:hypothetical protein
VVGEAVPAADTPGSVRPGAAGNCPALLTPFVQARALDHLDISSRQEIKRAGGSAVSEKMADKFSWQQRVIAEQRAKPFGSGRTERIDGPELLYPDACVGTERSLVLLQHGQHVVDEERNNVLRRPLACPDAILEPGETIVDNETQCVMAADMNCVVKRDVPADLHDAVRKGMIAAPFRSDRVMSDRAGVRCQGLAERRAPTPGNLDKEAAWFLRNTPKRFETLSDLDSAPSRSGLKVAAGSHGAVASPD